MKNIKFKIAAALTLGVILYAMVFVVASAMTDAALTRRFGPQTETAGTRLFFDGVVVGRVSFSDGQLDRVFLQGNPIRLLFSGPERIWIEQADVRSTRIFLDHDIVPHDTTLEIDRLKVALASFQLSGSLKTIGDGHYLAHFKAENAALTLTGKAEIKRQKDGYLGFDAEFDNARLERDPVSVWRGSGWAHLARDKNEWRLTGQADAGRVTLGDLDLADPVLRLAGTLDNPQISFSGLSGAAQIPVSVETTETDVVIAYRDVSKKIARATIDRKQLKAVSAFVRHDLEPPPEPVEKEKAIEKPPEDIPVLEDNFQVVEMDLPQKSLTELVQNSFFEGFRYNNPLTVVEESCGGNICWKARGQGGVLSYADKAVPSYLLRLADYEQSVQLRGILRLLPIERLTVIGENEKITGMIVKGVLADERKIYIELSLDDVH